jgi:hypothetical protein
MCSLERNAVDEDLRGALGSLERMHIHNLERVADQPEQADPPGALNIRKAVQAYRVGGMDPWSVIGCFAFSSEPNALPVAEGFVFNANSPVRRSIPRSPA